MPPVAPRSSYSASRPDRTVGRGGPVVASSLVLAGALCLSVSAILVKLAGVDAATTAVARCAIAVVVLVPLAFRERSRVGALSRGGVLWSLAAGAALGIDYAAWTASIYYVGAGISTVLINIQVLVLPALAFLIDRERVTTRFVITLPLMLLGISLVGGLWNASLRGPDTGTGVLLGVIAGCGYGVYLFITRGSARRDPGLFVQPLTWASASATVAAAMVSPISGGIQPAGISARSWTLLALLAVLGQVAAWLFIHHGSVLLPLTTTGGLLLIQPILALGLSALILGEHPTVLQSVGAAVVVAGVATANGLLLRKRKC
ncbi:DMT family transporter [Nocardiopsis sinuspersici]|uniref:DMT family transporter n=1 Tax=Nocardiopsis sinuspersici TaxID=501010 RepID=UPI0023558C10|nr:DMT family transporter [Nocardiopsis sinuspersici]